MALRPIVLTTLLILTLICGIYLIYSSYHRPLIHKLNPDLQLIGVITNSNNNELNKQAILNGESNLLVVDHSQRLYHALLQTIPQAKQFSCEDIFNIHNFHLFDSNEDGLLTEQDSIFKHLFIIHFTNEGNQEDITPLAAAGIKAINIKASPTKSYLIMMADGSQHTLFGLSQLEKNNNHKD